MTSPAAAITCASICCISDDALPDEPSALDPLPEGLAVFNRASYDAAQKMLEFKPPFPYQIVREWVPGKVKSSIAYHNPFCLPAGNYKIVPYSNPCETIHKMQAALQRYGVGGFKEHAFLDLGKPGNIASIKKLFQEVLTQGSPWNQEVDLIRYDLHTNGVKHAKNARLHREFIAFVDQTLTRIVREALGSQNTIT